MEGNVSRHARLGLAMLGRLWNFAKRHRKKFIFSAIFAGGAYIAWQKFLPTIQERMLQRLLKELADSASSAGKKEAPVDTAEKRRKRFEHKQEISDAHALKKLPALRQRQNTSFLDEACSAALKDAKDKGAKLEAFKALQVECLAKVASALYSLHLVLLTHRVGFNIVGREVEAGSGEDAEGAHVEFLAALEHPTSAGFDSVAQALRAATLKCGASRQPPLAPQTKMTAETLQEFLSEVCREADEALLTKAVAVMLPEGLEANASEATRKEVKRLLDEARDYLESPQFRQVFQAAVADALGPLAKGIVAELSGEGPWSLAVLFGHMTKNAGVLMDATDEASDLSAFQCARRFAEKPEVVQLSEGLYGWQA